MKSQQALDMVIGFGFISDFSGAAAALPKAFSAVLRQQGHTESVSAAPIRRILEIYE